MGTDPTNIEFVLSEKDVSLSDNVNFNFSVEIDPGVVANGSITSVEISQPDVETSAISISEENITSSSSDTILEFSYAESLSIVETSKISTDTFIDFVFTESYPDGLLSSINASMLDIRTSIVTSKDRYISSSLTPNNITTRIISTELLSSISTTPLKLSRSQPKWIIAKDGENTPMVTDTEIVYKWDSLDFSFLTTYKNKREHYNILQKNAGKCSRITRPDGSIKTVDTVGDNTFTLKPPSKLQNYIHNQKYCVMDYEESSKGRFSDQIEIELELSPIDSRKDSPEIIQEERGDKWKFDLGKSIIYTNNVQVRSNARSYQPGIGEYQIRAILIEEEVRAFKDTLTNLGGIETVNYVDNEIDITDYSSDNSSMIYITPQNTNILEKGLYSIVDFELSVKTRTGHEIIMNIVDINTGDKTKSNINPISPYPIKIKTSNIECKSKGRGLNATRRNTEIT